MWNSHIRCKIEENTSAIYYVAPAFDGAVCNRERKRTEPNPNRLFESSVEPNRMISIRFVPMVVLSFEKSSYILDQVLWFLLNESLVER
jgi:hypothetical protein